MPILPIDLQTLFVQMSNVGREQAVEREVPPQLQAAQASEIVRETNLQDRSVNETRDAGEGAEKVKEDEQRRREQQGRGGSRERRKPEPKQEGEVFRDPALGTHIDLVG